MVIAIDVGNSAVKAARVRHGVVGEVVRLPTDPAPGSAAVERILAVGHDPIALVSVVPAWTTAVGDAARAVGRRLAVADHRTIPIGVRVAVPDRVGADRLLGAWVARELVGAPCIVVDVGTATTIDVVDGEGSFAGGAILPGPALAMRALARGTALLPQVPLALPARAIGRDTLEAMASGVMLGQREAIGGLVARMGDELGRRPTVVLTGGDAATLGTPDWADRTEPELLLRGLGNLGELLLADRRMGATA